MLTLIGRIVVINFLLIVYSQLSSITLDLCIKISQALTHESNMKSSFHCNRNHGIQKHIIESQLKETQ